MDWNRRHKLMRHRLIRWPATASQPTMATACHPAVTLARQWLSRNTQLMSTIPAIATPAVMLVAGAVPAAKTQEAAHLKAAQPAANDAVAERTTATTVTTVQATTIESDCLPVLFPREAATELATRLDGGEARRSTTRLATNDCQTVFSDGWYHQVAAVRDVHRSDATT